jgi:hypothetical protein
MGHPGAVLSFSERRGIGQLWGLLEVVPDNDVALAPSEPGTPSKRTLRLNGSWEHAVGSNAFG